MMPLVVVIISTLLLSCFSTAVLSYISMAVMLGPWIDSTIVLLATMALTVLLHHLSALLRQQAIACVTVGASIGGILATACGFAFPTLYFLDKALFMSWLARPWYFIGVMGILSLCAGAFGFLLANLFEKQLLYTEKLPFPIGELSYKMIAAQHNMRKAKELSLGFILSFLYSVSLRYLVRGACCFTVLPSFAIKKFQFPMLKISLLELPMLWSIGFIAGHTIAIPLGIGILAKNLICGPTHSSCFTHLPFSDFLVAFAGGMVAYGAVVSFLTLPTAFKDFFSKKNKNISSWFSASLITTQWMQWIIFLCMTGAFLWYFNFGFLSQLFLLVGTAICTYQLLIIGGKIGIAPLARYATFVMLPGMMLFGYDAIQITFVSTFVEICGGVAVELLFGRKIAQLSLLPTKTVRAFQWFGLAVSAAVVGICFWVLCTKLGLGSEHLPVQRSFSRALLVNVQSFDFFALIIGALFASLLKELKINAIMVLGGLLMPTDLALPLVFGGLSSLLVRDKEAQYPFWSGIFAANSLWMFIKVLI